MRVYTAQLGSGRRVVHQPHGKQCDSKPEKKAKALWPAGVLQDPVTSGNARTCEQCSNFGRLNCGGPFCRLLGENKAVLVSTVLAGTCPIGLHARKESTHES